MVLPYEGETQQQSLIKFLHKTHRAVSITLFGSQTYDNDVVYVFGNKIVQISEQHIKSCLDCGVVSSNYFSPNVKTFTESLAYNSCLHGKISVDVNGIIKNCPSMKEGFGYVEKIRLEDALNARTFKQLWVVTKDQIDVCKDCEFRYVCTDCRAYVEEPEDPLSKPLKCGYDPYSSTWDDWRKNPLKQKTMDHYKLNMI